MQTLQKGDVTKKRLDKVEWVYAVYANKCIIKIQAQFRRVLCLKKIEKDIAVEKRRLHMKITSKKSSAEQRVMTEFKTRLARKNLTPEAFFRLCDEQYEKKVSKQRFQQMLKTINLQLNARQVNRLILIIDEDISGEISLEEFQNAVEAYKIAEERHVSADSTQNHVSFEHRSIFKLLDILNERNMSYQELFRACDVNNDDNVNLLEL